MASSSSSSSSSASGGGGGGGLYYFDFEIFGKVQGVFFRKNTQKHAARIGATGWVMNTAEGTVVGAAEGTAEVVADMKYWLRNTGSPRSRIDRAVFSNEAPVVGDPQFTAFEIIR